MLLRAPTQPRVLILTSSNASRTYFADAFQVLAWPRGWVAHFRYQRQWLRQEFWESLPFVEEANNPSLSLRGTRALVAYVFQELDPLSPAGHADRKQMALYLLRYGTVQEAYRVGDSQTDIAHFYFSLDGFYDAPVTEPAYLDPQRLLAPNIFADLLRFPIRETTKNRDESQFYKLVDNIDQGHLTNIASPGNAATYYPVAVFVRGLRRRESRIDNGEIAFVERSATVPLTPQFDWAGRLPYYELSERREYLFDFSYYVPKWADSPSAGSSISLDSDNQTFATPAKYIVPAESRYDEHAWLLATSATEREVWRSLAFVTRLEPRTTTGIEVSNVSLAFAVLVKPDRVRRGVTLFFDLVGDVGLAAGTVALAFIKNPPDWISSTQLIALGVFGYAVSIGGKLVARFMKP